MYNALDKTEANEVRVEVKELPHKDSMAAKKNIDNESAENTVEQDELNHLLSLDDDDDDEQEEDLETERETTMEISPPSDDEDDHDNFVKYNVIRRHPLPENHVEYVIPTCLGFVPLTCAPSDYEEQRRLVIGESNEIASKFRPLPIKAKQLFPASVNQRLKVKVDRSPLFLQAMANRIIQLKRTPKEEIPIHLAKYNQIKQALHEKGIHLEEIYPVLELDQYEI